jgi:hypothetical protein
MNRLDASDLFVLLERAFHRRSRECGGCAFSLPFRVDGARESNWAVIPSHTCSPKCADILHQVVSEFRSSYLLAE